MYMYVSIWNHISIDAAQDQSVTIFGPHSWSYWVFPSPVSRVNSFEPQLCIELYRHTIFRSSICQGKELLADNLSFWRHGTLVPVRLVPKKNTFETIWVNSILLPLPKSIPTWPVWILSSFGNPVLIVDFAFPNRAACLVQPGMLYANSIIIKFSNMDTNQRIEMSQQPTNLHSTYLIETPCHDQHRHWSAHKASGTSGHRCRDLHPLASHPHLPL